MVSLLNKAKLACALSLSYRLRSRIPLTAAGSRMMMMVVVLYFPSLKNTHGSCGRVWSHADPRCRRGIRAAHRALSTAGGARRTKRVTHKKDQKFPILFNIRFEIR